VGRTTDSLPRNPRNHTNKEAHAAVRVPFQSQGRRTRPLRVYRQACACRVVCAGLHSASQLAPRRPACPQAYGSGAARVVDQAQSTKWAMKDRSQRTRAVRSWPSLRRRRKLACRAVSGEGHPWRPAASMARRSRGSDRGPWCTPAPQPRRQRSCVFVGLVARKEWDFSPVCETDIVPRDDRRAPAGRGQL